jgi:hypothetical protein
MKQPQLSAMLWFRAGRDDDDAVREALVRACAAVEPLAAARIGHRHDEHRPYRTWMIDAGPLDADAFADLVERLQAAFAATGLAALAQAEPQLERFEWLPCP